MTKTSTIIKRPIISEKSLKDASFGIFTFQVDKKFNKSEITKEVENMFSVHVTSITTEIVKGKTKLTGKRRQKTKKPDIKKARVKLKSGEKIPLFEVGG